MIYPSTPKGGFTRRDLAGIALHCFLRRKHNEVLVEDYGTLALRKCLRCGAERIS